MIELHSFSHPAADMEKLLRKDRERERANEGERYFFKRFLSMGARLNPYAAQVARYNKTPYDQERPEESVRAEKLRSCCELAYRNH